MTVALRSRHSVRLDPVLTAHLAKMRLVKLFPAIRTDTRVVIVRVFPVRNVLVVLIVPIVYELVRVYFVATWAYPPRLTLLCLFRTL